MSGQGPQILQSLQDVAAERAHRLADAGLAERVVAVKVWQHARFAATYADLLGQPRYAAATRFFLDDLYGPGDFTQRDDQFARIVPPLVRLFPRELVDTVVSLGQLHALSEQMDTQMARAMATPQLDDAAYGMVWRAVGQPDARERQVALMMTVGSALERYVRNPLLRHSLRLMRGPAQAAGLGALQAFLERGFDTFRAMRGAEEFLGTIARRERALAARLFAGGSVTEPGRAPAG
jgi:hypothetical protein